MIAGSDHAVRRRIAEAVESYERGLADVIAAPDAAARRRLAGLATTLVFGTALRATLDDGAGDLGPGRRTDDVSARDVRRGVRLLDEAHPVDTERQREPGATDMW